MTPLGIWVPPSARPRHQCNICDEKFYRADKYVRHVTACARKHRDELEALSAERRHYEEANPLIAGAAFDQEALDFQVRRHREGRQ